MADKKKAGRPTGSTNEVRGVKSKERFDARLSPETIDAIADLAERFGVTQTEVVERAVKLLKEIERQDRLTPTPDRER